MTSNFFLYARKSTDTEDRQVLSIEAQLVELQQFAEKERLTIKKTFTEAMTAKCPGRPLFNEMISRIEKGEAQGIIAWHPDRLARNSIDGGRIIYLLDTEHINFLKFPTFWFENTPQGKFMMNIAFGQSKYFIDNLSENVKRGLRQKLRRGEWPSLPPMGYKSDKNVKRVVVDPVRAPLIVRLFETYATGKNTLEDLKALSWEWGLVSRKGKPVVLASLERVLKNSFYYGLMKIKGEVFPGIHEPLISKELFDQVQKAFSQNGKPNTKKHYFPLLGLASCTNCNSPMTGERQKGHHYYRCTRKRGECHEPYTREEHFAAQINAAIAKVALPDPAYQKMLAAWAKERAETTIPLVQIKTDRLKEISQIQEKLDRLLDAHLEEVVTQTEYQTKKEALLNEKIHLAVC